MRLHNSNSHCSPCRAAHPACVLARRVNERLLCYLPGDGTVGVTRHIPAGGPCLLRWPWGEKPRPREGPCCAARKTPDGRSDRFRAWPDRADQRTACCRAPCDMGVEPCLHLGPVYSLTRPPRLQMPGRWCGAHLLPGLQLGLCSCDSPGQQTRFCGDRCQSSAGSVCLFTPNQTTQMGYIQQDIHTCIWGSRKILFVPAAGCCQLHEATHEVPDERPLGRLQ